MKIMRQIIFVIPLLVFLQFALGCSSPNDELENTIRKGDEQAALSILNNQDSVDPNFVESNLPQGQLNEGFRLIHLAARSDMPELIQELSDLGADINSQDNLSKRTAVHEAISYEAYDSLAKLIELKADLELADEHQQTPLMIAAFRDHPKMVQLLIDNGADLNYKLTDGRGMMDFELSNTVRAILLQHLEKTDPD